MALAAIKNATALAAIKCANYTGVVFDAEEVVGSAEAMVPAFASAFAACQAAELKVIVTTSHSAPYQASAPGMARATPAHASTHARTSARQLYLMRLLLVFPSRPLSVRQREHRGRARHGVGGGREHRHPLAAALLFGHGDHARVR